VTQFHGEEDVKRKSERDRTELQKCTFVCPSVQERTGTSTCGLSGGYIMLS
jgi:hypothetical protein